ncbi:MAG: polyprenyl synthetase family protein [Deltaproteobacteria bacterium]|nr:polyprenyl synthetase family protein [Deltaproteobacteria bacterium]
MDIKQYMASKAEMVNKRLKELLVREDEYPQSVHKAMHYSLFAGGKRLRPALALASSEAVGADCAKAIDVACAIECIHTYSLIHDDLPAIDNDDLRRGAPTCHKAFGEAIAILAGDALLTTAFEIMAVINMPSRVFGGGLPSHVLSGGQTDNGRALQVISEIARAAGSVGMIGGQVVDIESEGKDISFPELEYMHIHKTGALMLASVRCGALMGGASDEDMIALTRYGEAVGLAFQIADDLLDVEGSQLAMGKHTGADRKKGKATYPAIMGVQESKRRATELADRAISSLEGFGNGAGALRSIAAYIVSRDR